MEIQEQRCRSLKEYIEEQDIETANYIIEEKAMVRQAVKRFGVSKSIYHTYGNDDSKRFIWIII